jgi:hypothetical protein
MSGGERPFGSLARAGDGPRLGSERTERHQRTPDVAGQVPGLPRPSGGEAVALEQPADGVEVFLERLGQLVGRHLWQPLQRFGCHRSVPVPDHLDAWAPARPGKRAPVTSRPARWRSSSPAPQSGTQPTGRRSVFRPEVHDRHRDVTFVGVAEAEAVTGGAKGLPDGGAPLVQGSDEASGPRATATLPCCVFANVRAIQPAGKCPGPSCAKPSWRAARP